MHASYARLLFIHASGRGHGWCPSARSSAARRARPCRGVGCAQLGRDELERRRAPEQLPLRPGRGLQRAEQRASRVVTPTLTLTLTLTLALTLAPTLALALTLNRQ